MTGFSLIRPVKFGSAYCRFWFRKKNGIFELTMGVSKSGHSKPNWHVAWMVYQTKLSEGRTLTKEHKERGCSSSSHSLCLGGGPSKLLLVWYTTPRRWLSMQRREPTTSSRAKPLPIAKHSLSKKCFAREI